MLSIKIAVMEGETEVDSVVHRVPKWFDRQYCGRVKTFLFKVLQGLEQLND